jgi:hypothetical protein
MYVFKKKSNALISPEYTPEKLISSFGKMAYLKGVTAYKSLSNIFLKP